MLNKIEEMMAHLNSQENSSEGFPAKTMYTTGMEFGLTCKEVKDIFLGKDKALARGHYPASCSDEVLATAKNAPIKMPKVKAPTVAKKAAAKTPVAPKKAKNVSTAVVEKTNEKVEADLVARRELIANIAARHAAEDEIAKDLSV